MSELNSLQRFKVGGAVRDRLLGYPSNEIDWVVVGATPEQMSAAGLTPVGRDFPVFIEPDSGDEYALARTERKAGHGYHGFQFYTSPDVTLEQDLQRRDLTVNAIAEDREGNLIDPCGGVEDLRQRVLRHISPAFCEDPLRVLRVARFAARYHHLNFRVAAETRALMADISSSGELKHLSAERVWRETERALGERNGAIYFALLVECGAAQKLFAQICSDASQVQHLLTALECADQLRLNAQEKFAVLACAACGDRARPLASKIETLCKRLRTPTKTRQLALQLCRYGEALRAPRSYAADHLLAALQGSGAAKSALHLTQLLDCLAALPNPPSKTECAWLMRCQLELSGVSIADVVAAGASGQEIGETLERRQIELLEKLISC